MCLSICQLPIDWTGLAKSLVRGEEGILFYSRGTGIITEHLWWWNSCCEPSVQACKGVGRQSSPGDSDAQVGFETTDAAGSCTEDT